MTAPVGLRFRLAETTEAADPWRQLAERTAGASALSGPDFPAAAAGRIEPAGWRLALVEDAAGTGLSAALPFRTTRRPPLIAPRTIDGLWSHYGPASGLLIDGGEEAAALLLSGLAETATVLRLGYLPLDTPGTRALEAAAAARGAKPILLEAHLRAALTPGRESRGPLLSGSGLKELRRQHRRLAELGDLTHEVTIDGAAAGAVFAAFLDLEASGWKGRHRSALASAPARRRFAETLVGAYAAAGGLRIDLLRLGGRPIAGLVTLRRGQSAAIWKIAYDETLARYSPGAQVLRLATDALMDDRSLTLVDSLAVPGHSLVDRAWSARIPVARMVLPLTAAGRRDAERIVAIDEAERAARRAFGRLKRRLRPGR